MLRKREALREVFAGFDPDAVAAMDPVRDVAPLLDDARLIRSGPKLRACLTNARATVTLRGSGGLAALLWAAAEVPSPAHSSFGEVPASTPTSTELAKRLKGSGFTFVGPTTVYSLLQACGLVNDHMLGCPVRDEVEAERLAVRRPA